MLHPASRPPAEWRFLEWDKPGSVNNSDGRSRRGHRKPAWEMKVWGSYHRYCRDTLSCRWHAASLESDISPCPGAGLAYHEFVDVIQKDLSTLPSGFIQDWWQTLGMSKSFFQLELTDQRNMQTQWDGLLRTREWVDRQLGKLQHEWAHYPTNGVDKCLMVDRRRIHLADRSVRYQSILYSKDYDRMYEG